MQSTLSATMFLFLFITQQGFAEVIVDGTLKGNSQVIPGPFYIIRDEIGMQKGKNIFHSFTQHRLHVILVSLISQYYIREDFENNIIYKYERRRR